MRSQRFLMPACLLLIASSARAQIETAPVQSTYLEYLRYQQYVHSASENTQLGQETLFDALVGYRLNEDTAVKFRLDIDPNRGSVDNKTSRLNLRLLHHYEQFDFQADLALNGDDEGRGATTVGMDNTSKYSWISYTPVEALKVIFYPYNFGTEIGREFRTWDVARVFFVEGTPAYISNLPIENETIGTKTVPGFELQWKPTESLLTYVGVGSAGFFYPATPGFTIEENAASERWKVKEDRAYKAGVHFRTADTNAIFEYASHTNGAEGGSMLDAAWSLQLNQNFGPISANIERTWTKASTNAYRLNDDMTWFHDIAPFRPVYSDYYGARQDWLGKTDAATMVKAGYTFGAITPFLAYKFIGQYFIDRERESAQRLRTADETASHGGLKMLVVGADYRAGKFNFRPEVEFMQAKNAVFGNRTDVREDRILSELNKEDTVVKLTASYFY
ncbi:MAG TPA: hypothetical protein VE954_40450 [Oligoflexus sp.]|uniref:hypothetical protein n=1 Tax=Oligoflexus sp. TaxID=1971216 RepID=UPI002D469E2E|nr:hypothetical protein [Oligoflexus sp.]HYX39413.1 hypothetical protein [Oligoflexus sp.]